MRKAKIAAVLFVLAATGCGVLSSRGEELPPRVAPTRSPTQFDDGSVKTWPRSAQVEEGVEYLYETGHCGLTYDLDFDGSFWEVENPNGDKEPPPFFINADRGYITLVSEDEARYESSTGEIVKLRRIDGPVRIPGCG